MTNSSHNGLRDALGNLVWSKDYEILIRTIMHGDLKGAEADLSASGALSKSEYLELKSTIEFQSGKLRGVKKASSLQRLFWFFWIQVPKGESLLRWALTLVSKLIPAAAGSTLFNWLRTRLAPQVVHYRYNNFLVGLVYSSLLRFAAKAAGNKPEEAYYQALTGLFQCLSGRFDLGLRDLDGGYQKISVLQEAVNGLNLCSDALLERYMTVGTLRALYLSYSGNHEEAYRGYKVVVDAAERTHRYVFIEIFLHSMKMFSDLETLNAGSLSESTTALKGLIGSYFKGLFALRASIYASLIAAIQGKTQFASHQLALSENYYSESLPAIEIGRYHFLRAMIHLELTDLTAAVSHATRSRAFVSEVQGAQFHTADALLLHLEMTLRIRLREGAKKFSPSEESEILIQIRRVGRMVKGCPLQSAKRRVLGSIVDFIQGRFDLVRSSLPQMRDDCQRFSLRFGHVLREIDVRAPGNASFITSQQEMRSRRTASIIDQFQLLLAESEPQVVAKDLFKTIVGGRNCEIREEIATGAADFSHKIEMSRPDLLVIRLASHGTSRIFEVSDPLVDVSLDQQAWDLLDLACNMVVFAEKKHSLLMAERNAAIVKTTQMLAHDIRKPFSQLQTLINLIKASKSPQETKRNIEIAATEVESSLRQVNAMLSDLMEIDAISTVVKEPVSIALILTQSLSTQAADQIEAASRNLPGDRSVIETTMSHTLCAIGDSSRLPRVFGNIIENAFQAASTRVWLDTFDVEIDSTQMIEIRIGNDGNPIAPEDLEFIFTPFFTKGKRGGTGLGLAIARKIVTAHGGSIRCQSSGAKTEFIIQLPVSPTQQPDDVLVAYTNQKGQATSEPLQTSSAIPKLLATVAIAQSDLNPEILIIDDNAFILDAWTTTLKGMRIKTYLSPSAMLSDLNQQPERFTKIRCVITDLNFEPGEICGLELARILRIKIAAPIFMASDSDVLHNGEIDAVIGKVPVSWLGLQKHLQ